jgi:hypothetical protein
MKKDVISKAAAFAGFSRETVHFAAVAPLHRWLRAM